jgi:tetrahydromethanopterin S-methyltransferase subunit G
MGETDAGGDATDRGGWRAGRFLGVTFRAGVGLFPILFSLNTVLLAPSRPAAQVGALALALGIPVGVEFAVSGRDVGALEEFVVGVILLWLVAAAARIGADWLGAAPATVDRIGLVLVAEGYLLSYLLIYRGWGRRLRERLGE